LRRENGVFVLEFSSADACLAAYRLPRAADEGADPDGAPNRDGFVQRLVRLSDAVTCECVRYHIPDLTAATFQLTLAAKEAGRVMGPKGARVQAIQRLSGARITSEPKSKSDTLVTVSADHLSKVERAVSLVSRARSGDKLGVPDAAR